MLTFPQDQLHFFKVVKLTSALLSLSVTALGRVHLCFMFNCRVIFCPCQHSARSNHPPSPSHHLPRRVSAAGTFCLRCQQFWGSEDIFAVSALSPKLFYISAHGNCATSLKLTCACNCHSTWMFLGKLCHFLTLVLNCLRCKIIFVLFCFILYVWYAFCSSSSTIKQHLPRCICFCPEEWQVQAWF